MFIVQQQSTRDHRAQTIYILQKVLVTLKNRFVNNKTRTKEDLTAHKPMGFYAKTN